MKIKMTCKNKINIIILFLYIFLNSLYYIIPYSTIYFNYKDVDKKINDDNKNNFNHFEFFGIILASTHIGILISRFIYSYFSKFKNAYIFYCICFLFSFIFIISSSFINLEKHTDDSLMYIHSLLFMLSRFFLGLSNERIITRKYLILFIPESQMRYFSILFLLISYIGLIAGAFLIFLIDKIQKLLNSEINEFLLYIIGSGISFIHLIIILVFFTEPNNDEGDMLTQILGITEVLDGNPEEGLLKDDKSKEKTKEKGPSINDQSKDFSDDLTFQENNKEIKIDNNINIDEEEKNEKDKEKEKVLSRDQLEGLNSIEKDIILMNEKSNFDDVNLVGNEIERIKKNQINNNKTFRKSFLAFVITLFLSNMINEYILIKTPFLLEKVTDYKDIKEKKWIISTTFILLILSSFPLIVFCRIIKKFNIGRRYLLIIYFLVFIILVGTGVYKFKNPKEQKPLLAIVFVTYLLNNCLEGITHLLIEKIIPSFAKFCGKNMKYLFSYFIHIGKAFGGINFFFFYFCFYKKKDEKYFNIDNIESVFFIGISFTFLIISIICYSSLRVRAFAKLRYYDD